MQHVLANLELEVDGDTAVGFSNLLLAVTLNSANAPDYAFGRKYRWTFARYSTADGLRLDLSAGTAFGKANAGFYGQSGRQSVVIRLWGPLSRSGRWSVSLFSVERAFDHSTSISRTVKRSQTEPPALRAALPT